MYVKCLATLSCPLTKGSFKKTMSWLSPVTHHGSFLLRIKTEHQMSMLGHSLITSVHLLHRHPLMTPSSLGLKLPPQSGRCYSLTGDGVISIRIIGCHDGPVLSVTKLSVCFQR